MPAFFNQNRRCALALAVACAVPTAFAQPGEFPIAGKPIRLVVGFPAGGGLDMLARTISVRLGEELGTPVIVENKAGGGGQIATEQVAKAKPDGHTLQIASAGPYTINRSLRASAFDPAKELIGISLLARMPLVLVTTGGLGVTNVKELVRQSRSNRLSYGSGGAGTLSHLAGEYFNLVASVSATHIPYKGSAPAAIDIASGVVPYGFLDPSVQPLVTAGKLKVIAVTTSQRSEQFPNVPTMAEAGVPGFEVVNWYGLAAPTGVKPEVVEQLNRALKKIMQEPGVVRSLKDNGMNATSTSAAEFEAMLAAERVKWARIVHQAHVVID